MIRYAITDLSRQFPQAGARRDELLKAVRRWAALGIEYVQLREKSLSAGELFTLAEELIEELRRAGGRTRLLVNGRADVAVAAGWDGVHLTASAGELTPAQVRELFARCGGPEPVVSVSCHSPEDAVRATHAGAQLILFGPVFEKVVDGTPIHAGLGLEELSRAVQAARGTPVLGLGGVTHSHMADCLAAGAAGVAGIRLFG